MTDSPDERPLLKYEKDRQHFMASMSRKTAIGLALLVALVCWLLVRWEVFPALTGLLVFAGTVGLLWFVLFLVMRPVLANYKYKGNVFLVPGGVEAVNERGERDAIKELMIVDLTNWSSYLQLKTVSDRHIRYSFSTLTSDVYSLCIDEAELVRHCEATGVVFLRAPYVVFLEGKIEAAKRNEVQ